MSGRFFIRQLKLHITCIFASIEPKSFVTKLKSLGAYGSSKILNLVTLVIYEHFLHKRRICCGHKIFPLVLEVIKICHSFASLTLGIILWPLETRGKYFMTTGITSYYGHKRNIILLHTSLFLGQSDCCWKVNVDYNDGDWVKKEHSSKFGYYYAEPGRVNGRVHYTSEDGQYAIAYSGSSWLVQSESVRGENKGYLKSHDDDECPHTIGYTWKVAVPNVDPWVDAGQSMSIWCKSK